MPDPATTDRGVAFPLREGGRSTTATGRDVLADAARAVDPALADAIAQEPDWRRRYLVHVRRLLEAELRQPQLADTVPAAGLAALYGRFEFERDGDRVPLAAAIGRYRRDSLHTAVVRGRGRPPAGLTVPYRGRELRGDDLRRQLDGWVRRGICEPSFAAAVRAVADRHDWLDLSDRTVLVLGAGAELGPLGPLCAWGAHVVAVDVPRPALWERLVRTARAGTGRVTLPVTRPVADTTPDVDLAGAAGADLITALPEVAAWLDATLDGPTTIGNYVYADGADNVRVSLAVDALTVHLLEGRDDVSLAVLATPTDVFAVPEEAVAESRRRYERRGPLARTAATLSGDRLYGPNYEGTVEVAGGRYGVADALVAQQGPNYTLAKRLHRWRAREARRGGIVSSINVAPPTATRSVTKNRLLAAAYAGAARFGVEVFEPATANVLMAAMLVHDLRAPDASSRPDAALRHPLELLSAAANPGGLWRIPWSARTVLPLAAVAGLASPRRR